MPTIYIVSHIVVLLSGLGIGLILGHRWGYETAEDMALRTVKKYAENTVSRINAHRRN